MWGKVQVRATIKGNTWPNCLCIRGYACAVSYGCRDTQIEKCYSQNVGSKAYEDDCGLQLWLLN